MGTSMTPYDELEAAAIEAQTPPHLSPAFSSTSQLSPSDGTSNNLDFEIADVQDSPCRATSKKPSLTVRPTKASQARITLAHGPKDRTQIPALGRPINQTKEVSKRVTSVSSDGSNDSNENAEKREVIIPHSKPRPMAVAFPPPPAPIKSTKAPTQSNFQLPGEAVAAKLKAAKEIRLQKEADEQKKKAFKARPVPASVARGAAVRQTNTSKARELLIASSKQPASGSIEQRSSSIPMTTTTRPVTSGSTTSSNNSTGSSTSNCSCNSPSSGQIITFTFSDPSSRPSTAMAFSSPTSDNFQRSRTPSLESAPRPTSAAIGSGATAAARSANPSTKGKELWARSTQALELVEQERREKEEAAKKARVEAAERSRVASRVWAEKQRVKKMVAEMEGKGSEGVAATASGRVVAV